MFRQIWAIVAVLCSVSVAHATLGPAPASPNRERAREALRAAGSIPAAAPGELQVTRATAVLVDGRECAYRNVPPGATVVLIEVAPDRRTVLRIEFRTRK